MKNCHLPPFIPQTYYFRKTVCLLKEIYPCFYQKFKILNISLQRGYCISLCYSIVFSEIENILFYTRYNNKYIVLSYIWHLLLFIGKMVLYQLPLYHTNLNTLLGVSFVFHTYYLQYGLLNN